MRWRVNLHSDSEAAGVEAVSFVDAVDEVVDGVMAAMVGVPRRPGHYPARAGRLICALIGTVTCAASRARRRTTRRT